MSEIAKLAATPGIHALGWTLLHFCWEGAAVAAALGVALAVIPRRRAELRYAAACMAMALMAALPLVTFARLALETGSAGERMVLAGGGGVGVAPAGGSGIAETWAQRCEEGLDAALPEVIGFWLAGVLILLGRLNAGLWVTHRLRTRAEDSVSASLQTAMRRLAERLGVRRTVRLLHSAQVQAPTVLGWLKPAILMPVGCLAGMSAGQVEAVLAHELGHVRRNDYLAGVLQAVVETALFYHPAVWWVSRQMRREREACCDDVAAQVSGDRVAYARALTMLEARRGLQAIEAMSATGGNLKMRIGRILGVQETPALSRSAAVSLLAVALLGAGVLAGAVRAQTAKPSAAAAEHETVWQAWVNQDVRWIITPREKQAFLSLKTVDERQEFVKQFWERRNPTPGSAVNAYKQEYYRRIAYANQAFPAQGVPGWETDRGHVYILFGPPDEIHSEHPNGRADGAAAWETWHYREIRLGRKPGKILVRKDVTFKFVQEGKWLQLVTSWPG
jgi:GWxTD domain-containing protein